MSIFDDNNKKGTTWWKYTKEGDQVEGTFVAKKQIASDYQDEQTIYELLTEDGNTIIVPGKPLIDDQMKNVRLGQIVGFRYTGEKPARRKGYKPTQVVDVFANKDIVNKEWLAMQDAAMQNDDAVPGGKEEGSIFNAVEAKTDTAEAATTEAPFVTEKEKIDELAKTKLGADDNNIEQLVMQETGIAFIAENYNDILKTLEALPNK